MTNGWADRRAAHKSPMPNTGSLKIELCNCPKEMRRASREKQDMALTKTMWDEVTAGCKTPQEAKVLYWQLLQHIINR